MNARFAEVAVTLPVPTRYTYRVPEHMLVRARVGSRVLVRFGTRSVTGVVVRERVEPPAGIKLVDVTDVLDDEPALPVELVDLCLWVADYYEAPPGEALRAALPVGTGEEAHGVIALTPAGRAIAEGEGGAIPPKQRAFLAKLLPAELPASKLGKNRAIVEALVSAGLVESRQHRDRARVRLRRERVVELAVPLAQARAEVARAPRRYALVDALAAGPPVAIAELERGVRGAAALVRQLARDGVVRVFERERPLEALAPAAGTEGAHAVTTPPELTAEQAVAVAAIAAELARQGRSRARREAASTTSAGAEASAASVTSANGSTASVATEGRGEAGAWDRGTATPSAASGDVVTERTGGASAVGANDVVGPPAGGTPPFQPFLLHGVTGSGKTEVYLRVIAEALEAGRTALVLVPEISLTPQLAARFRGRFGDRVAILHSGLRERQRLEEWSRLRRGEARIAVGARSAVFAPLANLGVIVVDEEHDGSFKQEEGLRYHARDVALVRAQRAGAVCVLGSATPSLETAAHAERGTYRRLRLTQRPTAQPMPHVEIVDLRTYMPDGDAMLSAPLRDAIARNLAAGDQTILFLNRRGFATFVLCRACGHSFRCKDCSVAMTYHRREDRLSCHYCPWSERVPDRCPSCKTVGSIERKGLGTEKVADAVAAAFPSARVGRLDRDVASGAKVEAVLARVARREVDVLVGTQMVTKGHDFPGVTLVGVLCADTGLDIPDFRSAERTFQLLAQVAGRAGRGERPGRVLIQTYRPTAPAVTAAAAHDYESFYASEMEARRELGYPPHGRLVAVRIDGRHDHEVVAAAQRLGQVAQALAERETDPVEVRGPVPAPLERIRTRTRWQIWLRSPSRQALRRVARALVACKVAGDVRVVLDIDPISTM